jgi:uncharacterized protein (TIGR03437 family)
LNRLRFTVFAALLIGSFCAPMASAQTAQNITILSGNGQIECQTCPTTDLTSTIVFFLPMVVKVTDSGGRPIPNKTINWAIVSTFGQVASLNLGPTTVTDANGIATNAVSQASLPGTAFQGFLQTTVIASADNASATFVETQALTDAVNHFQSFLRIVVTSPDQGSVLTGASGGPASPPIQVHIDSTGTPVSNISVRLVSTNDPTVGASAVCATGPGADPGSVLTDTNGNAVCSPILGPIPGSGTITVLVGGDLDATPANQPTIAAGFQRPGGFIQIAVTPSIAGSISTSSGTGQSANAGQTLPLPLVARVSDSTGASLISGATVNWTVSPAGAATFNPATSTSNAQGLASTNVTLSAAAAGQVTVTATLTGASSNISTTFTINAIVNITVTALQKVSGDGQAALVGTNFSQPLAVQVNSSAGAAANFPVTFSVSGPASIGGQTLTTVNTDATGKAQVTLTAGATTGSVTVTASAGGQTASFSESAIPVGPTLSASSFFNAAGLKQGSLSPCSLVTITAPGVAPGVQGTLVPVSPIGALPLTLGPDHVTFNNVPAPVLSVSNIGGQESVTVQVPCEVSPGASVPVTVNAAGGTATVNVPVQIASPGIFETPMSDGVRRAVAVRPDGSFVSLENPARLGEIIRVYVTGLGATAPPVGTNAIPIPSSIAVPGTDSLVLGQLVVGLQVGAVSNGQRIVGARLAPTQIGVYEVAFQVAATAFTGPNVILSVGIVPADGSAIQFSNASKIPVQ